MDNLPQTIWLIGFRPKSGQEQKPPGKPRFWHKLQGWFRRKFFLRWPQLIAQSIGSLPNGAPVRLLELPYGKAEFRRLELAQRRQIMAKLLHWLSLPQNRAQKIGMPLGLQALLPPQVLSAYRQLLANGWELAAQEFCRQLQNKLQTQGEDLPGRQIALLGVENAHPAERLICDALLAAGAQPALYGAHAVSLAEHYYGKFGVALPVFGARKAIRSSRVIIVLNGQPNRQAKADSRPNIKPVFYFHEPRVQVAGNFRGRFSFGSFAAGQAAALLAANAKFSLDK